MTIGFGRRRNRKNRKERKREKEELVESVTARLVKVTTIWKRVNLVTSEHQLRIIVIKGFFTEGGSISVDSPLVTKACVTSYPIRP
jgi:hypothetical protein